MTSEPDITITTPVEGGVYAQFQIVDASYSCSSPATITVCDGNVPSGSPIGTATKGLKTFTVDAEDDLGNVSSTSVSYEVVLPCLVPPTIVAAPGQAFVEGTEGDDVIHALEDIDHEVYGYGGDDIICTGGGADLISAGLGNDIVVAGPGIDSVSGDGGSDRLDGREGFDTLHGNAGTDVLLGKLGKDSLYAGGGPDTLKGGWGADTLVAVDNVAGNDELYGGENLDSCSSDGGDTEWSCP